MMTYRMGAVLFACLLIPLELPAAAPTFACVLDRAPDSKLFPQIQAEARAINEQICSVLQEPTKKSIPRERLKSFAVAAKRATERRFAGTPINKLDVQFDYLYAQLNGGEILPASMPSFQLLPPMEPGSPFQYYFSGNQDDQTQRGELHKDDDDACMAIMQMLCSQALKELAASLEPYQASYNAYSAAYAQSQLDKLSKEWDRYFEKGRALTLLDLAATTWFEHDQLKKPYLVGPPPRQWFLLHPEPVVEYIPDADDGDQWEAAVSVEWIGLNWWKDSLLGIPFGMSLTSTLSDRAGVHDIGHGVTLYFDNMYSVGWARHGHKDGYYLSVDLLSLFEDTKKKVDKYRNYIDKRR